MDSTETTDRIPPDGAAASSPPPTPARETPSSAPEPKPNSTPVVAETQGPSTSPAVAPVRRGRGTFGCRLRTETTEQGTGPLANRRDPNSNTGGVNSVLGTATATVLHRPAPRHVMDDDEENPSPFAGLKKNIPLDTLTITPNILREQFGEYDRVGALEVDTVRQMLFRGDKRRRYCVIVGNLRSSKRQVSLKLFGHRGLKPYKLQDKLIRLINLSIGRPRQRRDQNFLGAAQYEGEEGDDEEQVDAADRYEEAEAEDETERRRQPIAPVAVDADVPAAAFPSTEDHGAHSHGHDDEHDNSHSAYHEDAGDEGDVDDYLHSDEVVPLAVQRSDAPTAMINEFSLANSPVLTSRYFSTLKQYFLSEFRYLLGMDDVRAQNVAASVSFGAAYCCLARHGSHSRPLKHATFGEFVGRLNDEALQLYFLKDCPACVSRAVDIECGALNHETSLTVVKITFFSNERQGRSVARAVWDSEKNGFKLQDMENVGVSFNWTIFSLDETYVREQTALQLAGLNQQARNKTVAYPFEVEFRAFRRWKQHAEHPAASLAEAILDRLSLAEHNLLNHGSSIGYERMDLSHVCNTDYAAEDFNVESIVVEHTSRGKPSGTDLIVDNTTALFIENFAAARSLRDRIKQYGRVHVAEEQNASNNNYLRDHNYSDVHSARGIRGGRSAPAGLRSGGGRGGGRGSHGGAAYLPDDVIDKVLQPTSKLTFFKSRGSTIHWKMKMGASIEENIAPMEEALSFVQQVLHTANDIERKYTRGGAAPEAL